jgi:glycosyltransferase involved in cell wall biosynthesis
MFSLICTYYIIQLILAFILFYGAKKSAKFKPLIKPESTTIIIPFKNEADRFQPLIASINKTAAAEKHSNLFSQLEFIFVDDNSNDNSISILLNNLDITFKIVKLKNTAGKKFAIKKGVEIASYERILTLDADVSFTEKYLNQIITTPCEGLTILPVRMEHSSLIGKLNSCEFWFFQRLTFGLAGFNNYQLCNGANLLFTKSSFLKSLVLRTDGEIPSGDDVFLLNAIKQLSLPIKAINEHTLSVSTKSPTNFNALLNQRKRWLSKTNDFQSVLAGFFVLGSNLLVPICIYSSVVESPTFIIPLLIKLVSELMSVNDFKKGFIVIIHQVTYPIYLIVLIFSLLLTSKNNWRLKCF